MVLRVRYSDCVEPDYGADMRGMPQIQLSQQWRAIMEPMQEPLTNRSEGEWCDPVGETFHHD
jgi:L-rhamnose mutarotase